MPKSQAPRKPMNPVSIVDRTEAKRAGQLVQTGGGSNLKRGLVAGAVVGAGAGTGLYLHHRSKSKQKEKAVTASKNLINPFEEVVVFGKAYPVALPVPRSTTIRALVPTGAHVGHGNALKHVHNSKGGGGHATKLERYTGGSAKQRMGPFGKGMVFQDGMSKGLRSAFKAGFDPALRGPAKGAASRLGGAARKFSDAANAPRNVSGSGTFARKQAMQQSSLRRAGPIGF